MTDMEGAIDRIHSHTAVFTCDDVIDRLLDQVEWPSRKGRLLDPGAGHGDVLLRAIARLDLAKDDVDLLAARVEGWEFHPQAAAITRTRIADALQQRGWTTVAASAAGKAVVFERDFLLDGPAMRTFDVIVGNPPYIHRSRIPGDYRVKMDRVVPRYARHDMMHPYLEACSRHLAPGGCMAMVTSDRWLINENTAALREVLGSRLTFDVVERLGVDNPFYVPKTRRRNSPPRVHPVIVVARNAAGRGIRVDAAPVPLDDARASAQGPVLADHVKVMVAPWMGADGIFVVRRDRTDLPDEVLIPCVVTGDIHPTEDRLLPLSCAVIRTGFETPHPLVMEHLRQELPRMAPRGRRTPAWLPPTSFAHKLPLKRPGLLIPRIARRLRPIHLPVGVMPVNSNLVITDCDDPAALAAWLNDPAQQEWIARNAPPLEGGYLSITTTLLRRMPAHDLPSKWKEAA
ncbi:Eco57I restriction-modification methylase domain-containing protein [Sphingomonas sp. 3-13AW]|uniref:Eco57I restriction-modification methylase domain-containing protein n=1 Tax=Sphingomonas sp. 3-13AW TaxID=3050450 RepID=UPI003BB55960